MGGCGPRAAQFSGLNSKNAPNKTKETVCMTNSGKRVSWVTGGGSGIGEAGAVALAADGWTVVVSGRRKDALEAVVAGITKNGGKAEAIVLDVSKSDDVTMAADQSLPDMAASICWSTAPALMCRSAVGRTWNWRAGT